jgi:transposase
MTLRALRVLLAPAQVDDAVDFPVSKKKLAELEKKVERNDVLEEELKEAREEIRRLREKLTKVQNSLPVLGADPRTAAAVGVPTSKAYYPRPRPSPEEKRKPGGQPGHPGVTRSRPAPNAPPRHRRLVRCPKCGAALGQPCDEGRRPLTDLVAPRTETFDLVVHRYECGACGERVHAPLPVGEGEEFGPNVRAIAVTLRAHGMSLGKVHDFLLSTWGLQVSVATILSWERQEGNALDPTYQGLHEQLTNATLNPSSEGDETGFPINGENGWTWVGVGGNDGTVVYSTLPTRGQDGALGMWKGYTGGLTRDGYHSYNVLLEALHQMDLVHVNRWLQKGEVSYHIEPRGFLKEKPPRFLQAGRPPAEFLRFAEGIRSRLREAVLWHEPHDKVQSPWRFRHYERAVGSMRRFVSRLWKDPDAARIAKDILGQLPGLFLFLRDPWVSWNSNGAEKEVRAFVVHRKMAGGRRTWRGAWVLDRIMTVFRTCRKRGVKFLDVLAKKVDLLQVGPGPPSATPGD